nr:dipicolinate synthase subunit DpsA [Ruminococcus bromii]
MKKSDIRTFGIIGGDKRQLFLAKSISDSCYDVLLGGFDSLESYGSLSLCNVKKAISESDALIFPLPSIRTDGSLNTPFSNENILLDGDDIEIILKKPVFTTMKSRFLNAYPRLSDGEIFDYGARDDFAILNALPTAEGAIECAMREYEGTISDSKCLVTGFGRIGKILAHKLVLLGANVTVSARKPSDLAYVKALGYNALNTENLRTVKRFDIVFNTIPRLIFDRELLMNTDTNTLIIDLASLPGGVDFDTAEKLGIYAVRALSLPGKCAPKTAGEIIKTTVFDIIKEVYR